MVLSTFLHVAGLQRRRSVSVSGTNGILHHAGSRDIIGNTLHTAHLRASTTGNWAGVPLPSLPAEKTTERQETGVTRFAADIDTVQLNIQHTQLQPREEWWEEFRSKNQEKQMSWTNTAQFDFTALQSLFFTFYFNYDVNISSSVSDLGHSLPLAKNSWLMN